MKEPISRYSTKTKKRFIKFTDSILSVAILIFIVKAVTMPGPKAEARFDYFVAYVLLALAFLLRAFTSRQKRPECIKFLCFSAIFIAVSVVILITRLSFVGIIIMVDSYLFVMLVSRIYAAIINKKLSIRVINILLSLALGVLFVSAPLLDSQRADELLSTHAVLVAGATLCHIIYISFAQMRFGVLRKIIRKTFAAEIICGLFLLIISFSFIFQTVEPGINTYFDAIWFCFSIVTTIGLGDLSVVSLLSRTLAIILGIYGIVVVAVITSVIVNFYNEVKDDNSDEPDEAETDALPDGSVGTRSAEKAAAVHSKKNQ